LKSGYKAHHGAGRRIQVVEQNGHSRFANHADDLRSAVIPDKAGFEILVEFCQAAGGNGEGDGLKGQPKLGLPGKVMVPAPC